MTRQEQKEFITELCDNLKADIIQKIESGKIPERWDGWELREYLKDNTAWRKMDRSKRLKYNNDLLVNPL